MRKLMWLFLIGFVVLGLFATLVSVYAFNPTARETMDYYLGPTGQNVMTGIANVAIGVTTSPTWVTYIMPNLFPIGAIVGIIVTIVLLHPAYDKWTGFWANRHSYKMETKGEPIGRTVSSSTPTDATTRPTSTQTVTQSAQPTQTVQTQQKTTEQEKGETEG